MPVRLERPSAGSMTRGAVLTELPCMAVLVRVTAEAIQQPFVLLRIGKLAQPDARERRVVHRGAQRAPVFVVTRAAVSDIRVEGRGLPLQQRCFVRVTGDAALGFDPLHWDVTTATVTFQESVRCGQGSRRCEALPERGSPDVRREVHDCERRSEDEECAKHISQTFVHSNQRRPK
jgi:hypothetical protein